MIAQISVAADNVGPERTLYNELELAEYDHVALVNNTTIDSPAAMVTIRHHNLCLVVLRATDSSTIVCEVVVGCH